MFGGINPSQMQGMMKKMGISQTNIISEKVTIDKKDGTQIVINNPSVVEIKMQGNRSFQISGEIEERGKEVEISPEDVKTVMEKTGASKEEAKAALEKTKDLAEAILELSK